MGRKTDNQSLANKFPKTLITTTRFNDGNSLSSKKQEHSKLALSSCTSVDNFQTVFELL